MLYNRPVTRAISILLCLGWLTTTGVAAGLPRACGDYRAMQDSLRHLPPNMRFYEMDRVGLSPRTGASVPTKSAGLRLIGKWGAGPSVKVTGRDSLVFLSRGSQVAVINYADTAIPRVLSYIEVNGLVSRSVMVGNRLYIGSTGSEPKYIDAYDVSNPADPQKFGQLQTRLLDIDVVDTLVYTVAKDSFRVFNFADPANPRQIGACRDTGYTLSVCNGYAYIADRWGLFVVDARDPTNPHHEASWGSDIISVEARGNICCATLGNPNQPDYLKVYVLDARNPASIAPLGSLDSCGGYDLYLEDSLVFVSGYYTGGHEFEILSIADSTEPARIGTCLTPGIGFGVWTLAPLHRSFVADDLAGLKVIDISSLAAPAFDTTMLTAGLSWDIAVQGDLACVANEAYGLVMLDVSMPSRPEQIGVLDSTTSITTYAVAVRDSFAYMGYGPSLGDLHTVDISDPAHPVSAGGENLFNEPWALALRDSFVYCAEAYRFEIVNAARPRQPLLVGTCATSTYAIDVKLMDTLAYISGDPLKVINVARPDSPRVVGNWGRSIDGLDVVDTVLFVVGQNARFWTLSVADPAAPRVLDSITLPSYNGDDVAVVGTAAYVAEAAVRILDVSDPCNLRLVGQADLPYGARRLVFAEPYLYACCEDAGVCVLETVPPGVEETDRVRWPRGLALLPSVTNGRLIVEAPWLHSTGKLMVFDVAGKEVLRLKMSARQGEPPGRWPVDLSRLPTGVYVLRLEIEGVTQTGKVLITGR